MREGRMPNEFKRKKKLLVLKVTTCALSRVTLRLITSTDRILRTSTDLLHVHLPL